MDYGHIPVCGLHRLHTSWVHHVVFPLEFSLSKLSNRTVLLHPGISWVRFGNITEHGNNCSICTYPRSSLEENIYCCPKTRSYRLRSNWCYLFRCLHIFGGENVARDFEPKSEKGLKASCLHGWICRITRNRQRDHRIHGAVPTSNLLGCKYTL